MKPKSRALTLPEKKGVDVYCGDCRHTWIAFYLPMRLDLIGRFQNLACPMCTSLKVFCGRPPKLAAKS